MSLSKTKQTAHKYPQLRFKIALKNCIPYQPIEQLCTPPLNTFILLPQYIKYFFPSSVCILVLLTHPSFLSFSLFKIHAVLNFKMCSTCFCRPLHEYMNDIKLSLGSGSFVATCYVYRIQFMYKIHI